MANSTISTTIGFGITLGGAGYPSPLLVTPTGNIAPTDFGVAGLSGSISAGYVLNEGAISGGGGSHGVVAGTGVHLAVGSLSNSGKIVGGTGGAYTYLGDLGPGFDGGTGVDLTGANAINNGTITGGTGGGGGANRGGGTGGIGVDLVSGSLFNSGLIKGGDAQQGPGPEEVTGAAGGTGVVLAGGSLTNSGTIMGGLGAFSGFGGRGGAGADVAGGGLTNEGTITGGIGGNGKFGGTGGAGVHLAAGSVVNKSTITGGQGGSSVVFFAGYAGGVGVDLASGNLTNDGMINGGVGGFGAGIGGIGVTLAGGSLTNDGTITGGSGAIGQYHSVGGRGGTGIAFAGGALINNGVIAGGLGGDDAYGTGGTGGTAIDMITDSLSIGGSVVGGAGGSANSASLVGAGGVGILFSNGGTLDDSGFIGGGLGSGFSIASAVSFGYGAALFILHPGASFSGAVVAKSSYGNVLELAPGGSAGSIAGLGTAIIGFGAVEFDPGAGWFVEGSAAGLAAGQAISGFTHSDTIELSGFVTTSDTVTGAGLLLSGPSGSDTIGIQGSFSADAFSITSDGTNSFITLGVACFRHGTGISTDRGEIAVENLEVGDRVRTISGKVQPIIWLGHRRVDCEHHPNPELVWPIRISVGALGRRRPHRDLWLSPDHSVFIDGALIPIKCLINDTTIVQVPVDAIRYYHVELPHHDVLLANGSRVESYLETGARCNYGRSPIAQHPEFVSRVWEAEGYAPLIVAGPRLDAVRRWVDTLADAAGWSRVGEPAQAG